MSRLEIGQFESFQWALEHGTVPSYMVPGPGVTRAGK